MPPHGPLAADPDGPPVPPTAGVTAPFDLRPIPQHGTHGKRDRGRAGGIRQHPEYPWRSTFRISPTFGMWALLNADGGRRFKPGFLPLSLWSTTVANV